MMRRILPLIVLLFAVIGVWAQTTVNETNIRRNMNSASSVVTNHTNPTDLITLAYFNSHTTSAQTNTFSASGLLTLTIAGQNVSYGLSTNTVLQLVTNLTATLYAPITVTNVDLSAYHRGVITYGSASGGGTLTQSGGTLTFAPADLSSFVTASITNSLASTNWAKATFAPITVTNVDLSPYALTSSLGSLAYSNTAAFLSTLDLRYAGIGVTNVSLAPYALKIGRAHV